MPCPCEPLPRNSGWQITHPEDGRGSCSDRLVHRHGSPSVSRPPILCDLGDRVDRPFDLVIGGENAGRKANGAVILERPDAFVYLRRAMQTGACDHVVLDIEEGPGLVRRQAVDVEYKDRQMIPFHFGAVKPNPIDGGEAVVKPSRMPHLV